MNLKTILAPPVFDDPDTTANAQLLHPLLLSLLVLIALIMPGLLAFAPADASRIAGTVLPIFITCLGLLWLERWGRVRLASGVLVVVIWLLLMALAVSGSGVTGPAFGGGSLTVIVLAGLLLGGRASAISATASMGVGLLLLVAQARGLWSPAPLIPEQAVWAALILLFWTVVVVQQVSARIRQTMLTWARSELAERRRAEAALRQSEERYRLISSVISDYTFSNRVGPQGELEHTLLGGAFETITGYTPEEFNALGGWRAILHPDDKIQDEADMVRLHTNQKVVTEVRLIRKNGEVRWARVYAHPVWDEARRRLTGIFGAVQDITDRKRAEEGQAQRDAILQAVAFAAEQFLKTPDWQSHIGVVLERLGQKTNASHVYISQNHLGPDGTPVTSLIYEWTAPGLTPDLENPTFQNVLLQEAGFERWTNALMVGEPFYGSLKTFSPVEAEFMVPRGVKSLLDVPIYVGPTWWGIIGFDDYRVEREWSLAEVDALRVAAGMISAAIQRQRADAARQQSETIYRQAIMAAGAVPYYRDPRTLAYTFMGEGILPMTGYSVAEMTPALFDSLFEEGIPRGALAHLTYAEADRLTEMEVSPIWECDYHIHTRAGQKRWVADASVKVLDEQGQRVGIIGILQDITDRMLAEEALRAREELYRLISTISADYVFSTQLEADGQLRLKWVGGGFETITGYTFDEYLARGGWLAALHPDDREVDARDMAALHANQKVVTEVRTFHKNGEVRWVRVYAHPLWDAEHHRLTGIYGAVQNITERKQAEERAQSTVKGLRAVVEAADELLRTPNLDTFYRRAVELGREKLGLERCGLFLIDETQTYLLGTYGTDEHGQTTHEHGAREPLALRAALLQLGDRPWNVISSDRGYWDGDQHRELSRGWVVGTAIRSVHGPIGLLYNDAALSGALLNDVLQETVAVYCSMLGNILERKQAEGAVRQLNTQLEQRAAQLATLNEIGRAVSSQSDLPGVMETVYQQASRVLPLDFFFIGLYDAQARELSFPIMYDEGRRWEQSSRPATETTFAGQTILSGKPLLLNQWAETTSAPTTIVGDQAKTTTSLMFAPLTVSEHIIGVISVQSYRLNAYNEDDLALLTGIGRQVAIAIENARLFEAQQRELADRIRAEADARRQLNELSVLHAIGMAAAAAAHEDELLARVVLIIGDQLYPDIIGVLLADPVTGVLQPHPASRGLRPDLLYESVPPGMGIIGQVASRGQAWRIPDVQLEPAYVPLHPGIVSEVCVPLKTGEQVIGVINLESERAPGFSEADERLLVTIAGQLASAIEHLRAQVKIRQLNIALEQRVQERTAQLQEANRELESFSYSVSHDLRAPLRGIDGFARILVDDYAPHLDEAGQRYLQRVRANAQRMGKLIDDLLEFSRLGRQPLHTQTIDPAALVRQVWEELKPDDDRQRVELSMGDLPECAADPALLRQVWVNLIGNALKYSSQRAVARLEVGWRAGAYYVRDNGAGFDMRYADKLFGVFQRLHSAEEFEGTGVGLANVKRIIERHSGRVWAEAEVDRGATFYFTLGAA